MSGSNGHALKNRAEIDALKMEVDLAALIRESGVELKAEGAHYVGRCPFHDDQTPSLVVNMERRLWHCFGCQAAGDAFSFLQLKEGLAFPQALARLRERVGPVRLFSRHKAGPPPPRPAEERAAEAPSRAELLGRVAEIYAQRLRESREAQDYLTGRGLGSPELHEAFQVGFSDGALLDLLPPRGELRPALTVAGVITAQGRERFAGCIVVPLGHPDEGVVGLYGRKIHSDGRIRHLYLPGPQRGVLNWEALRSTAEILVAESVLDALSLWQAGCRGVTCLYGVHGMPRDLEALLGRCGVRAVRFCLDADDAGRQATERLAAELAGRGIRCAAVPLPDGKDPNEVLVEQGPAALRGRVEAALVLDPPPAEPAAAADAPSSAAVERTGDGLRLVFAEVEYRVTPRGPFAGKLRALVRGTRHGKTHFDTLDLYSHRSRAIAVNQFQGRLEMGREETERHFLAIVEEAEKWVGNQPADGGRGPDELVRESAPELTAAEREEALAFLRRPDLVDAILGDMEALGYVGEERTKLLAYLIGLSRKLERPLAGVILSQSGAGKSSLADQVEALTPPEELVVYSRLSAQALGYVPKDYLKRRLLILEERVGGEASDYNLRVLLSKQKLSSATVEKDPTSGRMRTRRYEVEGPISYLETTTNPHLNHENATRCFELTLDESEEQTRRIQARQRMSRSLEGLRHGPQAERIQQRHHNAQRLLETVRVMIPYVAHLSFPSRWLRTRRDNERFLCLIEAAAFLHQHQRRRGVLADPAGGIGYVEATLDDYRLAYDLARDVLGITLHELTRGAQDLLEAARERVCGMSEGRDLYSVTFTRRDLRAATGWPDRRLREGLQELVDMEYLAAMAGSQGRTYHYRLLNHGAAAPSTLGELTTPEQLQRILEGGDASREL